MGKKRKCLKTIGTASNPLKCGKGSGCLEKDTGCILWHPPDEEQHPPDDEQNPPDDEQHPPDDQYPSDKQHPPDEQHLYDEQDPPNQEQPKPDQKAESLYRAMSMSKEVRNLNPTLKRGENSNDSRNVLAGTPSWLVFRESTKWWQNWASNKSRGPAPAAGLRGGGGVRGDHGGLAQAGLLHQGEERGKTLYFAILILTNIIIMASFIKEGADKESREAFKILIQEYRPKGYQK